MADPLAQKSHAPFFHNKAAVALVTLGFGRSVITLAANQKSEWLIVYEKVNSPETGSGALVSLLIPLEKSTCNSDHPLSGPIGYPPHLFSTLPSKAPVDPIYLNSV